MPCKTEPVATTILSEVSRSSGNDSNGRTILGLMIMAIKFDLYKVPIMKEAMRQTTTKIRYTIERYSYISGDMIDAYKLTQY